MNIPPVTEFNNNLKNERYLRTSFVLFFMVAIGVGFDQFIKFWVFSQKALPGWLVHFHNNQFAFSLPVPIWLIYVLYVGVFIVAAYYFLKRFKHLGHIELTGWVLLFAGGISNVGERIFLGYVRDYLLIFNGIFNLADIFIVAGILILLFNHNTLEKY
jgi:lipoprotein signal peptidase